MTRYGNTRSREEPVAFEGVEVIRETERALLVLIEGEEHWIPKTQIDDDSEVYSQKTSGGRLVVTAWIAKEKNLV